MIDVSSALQPPRDWIDTPEQAALRSCLRASLSGHEPTDLVRVATELIELMRDQLLSGAGTVRRQAALEARSEGFSNAELAERSGQTPATIARLLTEARQA